MLETGTWLWLLGTAWVFGFIVGSVVVWKFRGRAIAAAGG